MKPEMYELQVGQWVQFKTTNTDYLGDTAKQRDRYDYDNDRLFLVVTREDLFEPCRCDLIDNSGTRYDYCPSKCMLERTFLDWESTVVVVLPEDVKAMIGEAGMRQVYEGAHKCFAEMHHTHHCEQRLDVVALLAEPLDDEDSSATLRP